MNEDFSIQSMSYACPRCQTFWGTIKSAHDSAVLLCRKCQNRWEVFSIGAQINAFPDKEKRGESATLREQLADVENQRKNWQRLAQNQIDELANLRKKVDHLEQSSDNWEKLFADETHKRDSRIAELQNDLANEQMCHRITKNNIEDLRSSRMAWKQEADKFQSEADVLREENRRLINQNALLSDTLSNVTKNRDDALKEQSRLIVLVDRLEQENTELESYRKLSGEYSTLAKRDAIREANKRLQQENQQHAQQIKSLQADLNEAIKKNSTFAHIEAERNGWKVSAEEHKAVANTLQQRFNDTNEKLAAALNERDDWKETASTENRNCLWLRRILNDIGAFFGDAAKTDDTGTVTAGVFYSKLPKLVEDNLVFRMSPDPRVVELKKQIERAREALAGVHNAVNHSEKFLKGFKTL